LNTDTFEFYVFSNANFDLKDGKWHESPNQDARNAYIIWSGQMICTVPRENFVLTSVGAS